MAPLDTGANICGYASGLQLCRRRRAEASKFSILELSILLFGVAWWVAAATTATVYSERADDLGLEEEPSRTAVWSLAWANVALFSILACLKIIKYFSRPRKIRYPVPPPGAVVGTPAGRPPFDQMQHQVVAAPPAHPLPPSPFISSGYPTAPGSSSTIQMYGGYPLATEPPPPTTHSR
ncbi:hypothetical protein NADE_001880 [Nannochloris sp. 'desiccata']|nr:hypothetical protein KSW81_002845 [Chlorella desiccata (nom. nud.)]KAH7624657.1 hypothetical protein NADE_001880 [Chlorella desiccata (nom. nud.)]